VRYADSKFPLNMSDGTQNTGGVQSVPAGKEFLDLNGDGKLTDDERDIDNDNLSNWVEAHGPLVYGWWQIPYKQEKLYSPEYPGVDWLDQDSDGDGVIDGLDDQDHDGWNNMSEVSRTTYWVNPYNPCLPDWKSPTCSLHPPPPENAWPPFGTGDSGFVPPTALRPGLRSPARPTPRAARTASAPRPLEPDGQRRALLLPAGSGIPMGTWNPAATPATSSAPRATTRSASVSRPSRAAARTARSR
jgi:hypothetical protein